MSLKIKLITISCFMLLISCDKEETVSNEGLLLVIQASYDFDARLEGQVNDFDSVVVDIEEIRLIEDNQKLEFSLEDDYEFTGLLSLDINGEREHVASMQRNDLIIDEIRVYHGTGSYMILDGQKYELEFDYEGDYISSQVESDILLNNGWRDGLLYYAVYENPDTNENASKYLLKSTVDIPLL